MVNHKIKSLILAAFVAALITPTLCQAVEDYIEVTPFLRKSPLAVPRFKAMSGSGEETELSGTASELLAKTLEFTGIFKIIDPGAFLEEPQKTGIVPPHVNFQNWTTIGAELLVTGGVLIQGGSVKMELRLFDTFNGRTLVGKLYRGRVRGYRKIIHKFCGEIMYRLTNSRGIFNSKIAFVSTGTGNKEIYICDFDGHNPVRWTHTQNITLSPAWSSDGQWIAYTAYPKRKPFIYIRHISEKRGAVVSKKGTNASPAWIPGKLELSASMSFSGDPEIYLLTNTGKITKRLTYEWGIDVSPTWSPDGKQMAFVSNRSGSPQIYIQEIDTGNVKRLTFQGPYNTSPSWSPKGDKIAYSGSENGRFDIYVIGLNGEDPVQLTKGSGDNESPSWAPDGSLIAFSSTREGASRIYVMTAFGTDQRRLLTFPGEQTDPSWSPEVVNN